MIKKVFWSLVTLLTVMVLALDVLSYYEQNKSWLLPNIRNGALYTQQFLDQKFGDVQTDTMKTEHCKKYCAQYKYVSEFPDCSSVERLGKKLLCFTTIPKAQLVCVEERCERS